MVYSNNLLPLITKPTGLAHHTSTLIDHIYTNSNFCVDACMCWLMSQIILLPVLDRQISRYKRAFYFRDYDNFDVDQYVRDVDRVDLINVYNESIDIHEEAVNCMSILKQNGNKNAHIKKKETIGLTDNNSMRDI